MSEANKNTILLRDFSSQDTMVLGLQVAADFESRDFADGVVNAKKYVHEDHQFRVYGTNKGTVVEYKGEAGQGDAPLTVNAGSGDSPVESAPTDPAEAD